MSTEHSFDPKARELADLVRAHIHVMPRAFGISYSSGDREPDFVYKNDIGDTTHVPLSNLIEDREVVEQIKATCRQLQAMLPDEPNIFDSKVDYDADVKRLRDFYGVEYALINGIRVLL
jgi:hypothetical protein